MIRLKPLSDLLWALDGVPQDPIHHPEGDVLFHSLQVFQHAQHKSFDPEMWAAALFHDIGKAIQPRDHAAIGADLLDGWVSSRVVWLVRHHMDLLLCPQKTRKKLRGTPQMHDLEQLRRWDQAGRDPYAQVIDPDHAIELIAEHLFSTPTPRKGRTDET
jgi:predicted HD phosphohydrolase